MSEKFESEKYSLIDEDRVGEGMEAKVDLVKVRRGNREISLVRKRLVDDGIYNQEQGIEKFRKSVEIHQMLKNKKYPIPNVWRLDKKTNDLYVSDLSDEGKRIVIDGRRLGKINRGKESVPIKLAEHIRQQLREQLAEISSKATADQIIIPGDVWFIVADKSGENAEIILGDITGIGSMEGGDVSNEAIQISNQNSVNSFSRAIDALS